MSEKKLVWYACYGSNLLRDRFLCYISGGTPEGALRQNIGATDPTLPLQDKPFVLPFQLYFAQRAASWQNGGVAFIDGVRNEEVNTLGRMYLITEQQFIEVVRQENGLKPDDETLQVDLEQVKQAGDYQLNEMWYGRMIYVGEEEGHPIFTFTFPMDLSQETETLAPSENYLRTIANGIRETHSLSNEELAQYFISKPGVAYDWDEQTLSALLEGEQR